MSRERQCTDARAEPATRRPARPTATALRGSLGEGTDGHAIRNLAALSNRPLPEGALLIAEVNGDPVAAIGIFDGQAVADPARSTLALRIRLQLERLFLRGVIAVTGV